MAGVASQRASGGVIRKGGGVYRLSLTVTMECRLPKRGARGSCHQTELHGVESVSRLSLVEGIYAGPRLEKWGGTYSPVAFQDPLGKLLLFRHFGARKKGKREKLFGPKGGSGDERVF